MKNFFIRFSLLMLFVALVAGNVHGDPAPNKALPVQVSHNQEEHAQDLNWGMESASMWEEMDRMNQKLNQMFRSSFTRNPIQVGRSSTSQGYSARSIASSVDISETADLIVVSCDVPGIDKQDLTIDIHNNVLMIKGERKNEVNSLEESEHYQYHYQERSFGGFERSFVLPAEVDTASAVADHKNGVLTVRMKKLKTTEAIRVPIQ